MEDALERDLRRASRTHRPAWAAFNRATAGNADVGIWHETYRVRPGDMETIYNNMPPFGLARATRQVPAQGHRETARDRMALTAPPVMETMPENPMFDPDVPPAGG